MHAPFISVIIPVRNEGEHIRTAIRSMIDGRSEPLALEIVIIDDASTDGCCDALPAIGKTAESVEIQIVRLPQWSGIPFARNAGAAAARAPLLFITDANVRFPDRWDLPIRQHQRPQRVLCATIADQASEFRGHGCTLHIPSMSIEWIDSPGQFGGAVPISPCTGTVIETALFRAAGGYDTAMPIYGAAEPEFSVRLWLYGAEIVNVPELVLLHRFRPPEERQPFLQQIRIRQLENYLRFGMLYLDQPRMAQLMQHYASRMPGIFPEALRRVSQGDVWRRRALLEERLPQPFSSFVKRFRLLDGEGQVACN